MALDFSIPTALPPQRFGGNSAFEVPQHIIPRKIRSTTGRVTAAERLCDHDPSISISEHCALETSAQSLICASIILDFGTAIAGIPVLNISSLNSSAAIIDLTVSESYPAILQPNGDGPFPFSPGADTMRRVRFRVSTPGYQEGRHVQGSQRWMKITLVSSGQLSISVAGFKPTTSNIPLNELPGCFECSDTTLSRLWEYGARTVQLNCIPERTVPPPWSISEDMGVLVDSQRCNAYAWGGHWEDYVMEFTGMIIHDGLAWNCRVMGARPGLLFQLNLDDEGIATLQLWYGYYDKPQVTLIPVLLDSRRVTEPKIAKDRWYIIKTICEGDEEVVVYIDGVFVAKFDQGRGIDPMGPELSGKVEDVPKLPKGSVGIGAGQDQVCRFKDLHVTSLPSREVLYSSALNNTAILSDFSLGWNQLPYIFDGAKRDRYAWTADVIIGGKSVYYSTAEAKYIRGNLEASLRRVESNESAPGLLPGGVAPGRGFERERIDSGMSILTVNYSLYTVMVIYDYWMFTGDHTFIAKHWPRIIGCLSYVENLVNPDGLVEVQGRDAGDYDYYNGSQSGVSTKRNALYVATLSRCAQMATSPLVGDSKLSQRYLSYANRTALAIHEHMYDVGRSCYNITNERTIGLQQEAHAWLLMEGIIPQQLQAPTIKKLQVLYQTTKNQAPLSFTAGTPNVPPVISPIMSAFHILGALKAGEYAEAEHVLRRVWEPMCDRESDNFTGTTWEFMNPDLSLFEGDVCSSTQLFSAGPTFILSQYVLGVEAVTAGFETFRVSPSFPISGVRWAQGRVPTPLGHGIEVRWQMFETGWRLDCTAPKGLTGNIVIPSEVWEKRKEVLVNGKVRLLDTPEIGVGGQYCESSISACVIF